MSVSRRTAECRNLLAEWKKNERSARVARELKSLTAEIAIEQINVNWDIFMESIKHVSWDDRSMRAGRVHHHAAALLGQLAGEFDRQHIMNLGDWENLKRELDALEQGILRVVEQHNKSLRDEIDSLPLPERLISSTASDLDLKAYKALREQLLRDRNPRNGHDARELRKQLKRASDLASKIRGTAPSAVVAFLEQVKSAVGADILSMTPEIYKWLQDNNALAGLRVTRNPQRKP